VRKFMALIFVLTLLVAMPLGQAAEASELKVGVVFSIGGLGDESFNDAAYAGATQAAEEFGIRLDYVEPDDIAEMEDHQRAFVEEGYDLIIAIGFLQESGLEAVAMDYPDAKLAIVDSDYLADMPNVASLVFKEHEGSFLAGYLAGRMTETNVVGFVGGMEVPVIFNFQTGYEQGVRHANPDATILINYAGDFGDPGTGKELAVSQFERGADIIYHAAGGTGMGVFEAAEENDFFAIGVDDEQDGIAPGYILTSMLKRVDTAVYDVIADLVKGEFHAGVHRFGLADEGVGLTDFPYTADLIPDEVKEGIEEVKQKIIDGEINVKSAHD